MLKSMLSYTRTFLINTRLCSSQVKNPTKTYETVFSFPFIKYISVLNRLKVYQIVGTSLAVPGCGLLQILDIFPEGAILSASYIGLTGTALLTLACVPFKNTIGFLYISSDNQNIRISTVDFWGKRTDREISAEEWTPLLDIAPKLIDTVYLSPKLSDGTKYKLFVKFGNVLNSSKMGEVLE